MYAVSKVVQFALPVAVLLAIDRERLKAIRLSTRGLAAGGMVGATIVVAITGIYFGALRGTPILSGLADSIRAKATGFGLGSPAGLVTFVDPESGEQLEVQTSDERLRLRYAQAALAQRDSIASMLRRAGADHLQLRTDSDWLADIVKFVVTRRRGVAVRPPSRAGMIGTH